MLDRKTLIEILEHKLAKKPKYSLQAKSFMLLSLLGIVTVIIFGFVYFASSNIYAQMMFILSPLILLLLVVATGTLSAKCAQCHNGIRWYGFTADRNDSIKIRSAAIKCGFNITLPYTKPDETCSEIGFDTFVCDTCRILYITNVSDPSGGISA